MLRLGDTAIHMVRGRHPMINNITLADDSYQSEELSIGRAGLFVIVSATQLKIELLWDQG